jgi:hypothetical protein
MGSTPRSQPGSGDKKMELNDAELELLVWLGGSEFSQYGECYGTTLDSLVTKGFAQIHEPGEHQESFIIQGHSSMHRAVSLTDAGREELKR